MLCVFYMKEHSIWITVFYTPWWLSGKESACNAGDPGLVLGRRRSPWRRAWQPSPVFLPGKIPWTEEAGGLQSMWSPKSQTRLSD